MKDSPYFKQAQLMLRVMPHVAAEECFALKGGTAINLYVRDMPRLSVDIDLTYLPLEPRNTALASIGVALQRIATEIRRTVPRATVQEILTRGRSMFQNYPSAQQRQPSRLNPIWCSGARCFRLWNGN